MEPEPVGPDANHTPAIEQDAGDCNGVEHGLGAELEVFLTPPEREYPEALYDRSVSSPQADVGEELSELTWAKIPTMSR